MAPRKQAPKISQREARRLKLRVSQLEHRLRDMKHFNPGGERIKSIEVSDVTYEAARVAHLLGFALIVQVGDAHAVRRQLHIKAVKVD